MTDKELVSGAQKDEWQGQLELAQNHLSRAAVAFECVLAHKVIGSNAAPELESTLDTNSRTYHRAVMGLVETSLITGRFRRAVDLLSSAVSLCGLSSKNVAQIHHLRARSYAGLGYAAAALEEFSISISNYAIMLQNQGRTVDVWYKLERSADQNNYTRKQEDTARAKHHVPSVVERGLAMVYYHRSLFQTAMAFRLREEPNMYTNQDECSKKETDRVTQELDSSAVVLPRLVTSHASTAKSSPCSPNIKGGNQDPVHLAISNLFDFSSEAGSQRARLSRKAKVRPRTTLSPPRTRDARFSTEALHCLGLGDLTEALGENPDLVDARLARAELHISGGNNAFALADLNAVLKRAPHCVEARINRAVLSLNLHQSVIVARADLDDAVSALALRHKTAKGRSPGHSEDAVSDSARPIPRPTTTRVCLALALCCNRCLRVKRTHIPDPSRYNRAICFAIASDFNKSQADFSRSMDLLSPALSKDRASQLTILEKNFGRRSSTGETHQRMALRILASALVPEPRDCWREEM